MKEFIPVSIYDLLEELHNDAWLEIFETGLKAYLSKNSKTLSRLGGNHIEVSEVVKGLAGGLFYYLEGLLTDKLSNFDKIILRRWVLQYGIAHLLVLMANHDGSWPTEEEQYEAYYNAEMSNKEFDYAEQQLNLAKDGGLV